MARGIASRGVHVVLAARREDVLRRVGDNLSAEYGVRTRIVAIDLADDASATALADAASDLEVGLFAACAGFGSSGLFIDRPIAGEIEMLHVNCRAVLELTHHFGRRLARRGRGGIVLMSSIVAFQGVPRAAHYAATKAYIQTLAEGLARELSSCGVDVIASAPGPVRSGFGKRADMQMGVALTPDSVSEQTLAALGRRVIVRPGWLSKVLSGALATAPRFLRVRILEQVMAGMTRHQSRRT
jgi:short-subunit dehydrogenase